MGLPTRPLVAALLLAVLGLASSAPADVCPRACRCFSVDGEAGANCSSPAAAVTLGSRLRVLRLSHYDDHLSVKEGAFRALGGLKELHLDHLGLVKVYPGAFRGLANLETLDLSHNALSTGDELSRALRDLPSLRRLSLRGNNFGASHGVPPALVSRTLKFVDLGGCKLREIPETMLAGLTHVRHVVLDGNFIRFFTAATFPKSVVSIDLSHNDIDRISRAELNKLDNVDAIELAENPLHCSCELLKISYDYNMNKPVVCASPKQLMGKDLLKIKKHQVCGNTKKVKREADNELDGDAVSEEDLENEEGIVYDSPDEFELENAAESEVKPVHTEDGNDKEEPGDGGDGTDDNVENDEETAHQSPSLDEKKSEVSEHADDGPENIDGVHEEQPFKEQQNLASEPDDDTEDAERVDEHLPKTSKSELPPDEEDNDPENTNTPEDPEIPELKPSLTSEDLEEPDSKGDAIRTDDADTTNTEDEVDNDAGVSNGDALAPAESENKNTAVDEGDAATQDDPLEEEEEAPDSLPPSTYNQVQAASESADRVENNDEINNGNTKEETAEELPKETPVQTNDAAEEVEDVNNEETEGGVGGILEGTNSKEQESEKENQDGEQNLSENADTVPSNAANLDGVLDDVEEAGTDQHSEVGAPVSGEGARIESDTNIENAADEDGDKPVNEEDKDLPNNEDNVLSSVLDSQANENEAINNGEEGDSKGVNNEDGTGETDTDVENVDDKTNVVATSDIGARAETDAEEERVDDGEEYEDIGGVGGGTDDAVEDKDADDNAPAEDKDAGIEDGTDDNPNTNYETDAVETVDKVLDKDAGIEDGTDDDTPTEDKDAGIEDGTDDNTNTNYETDAVETADKVLDNSPEDDENDDMVPGSVVAAANKNEDEVEEENGDVNEETGAEVVENNEKENVNEPEKSLEEELEEDKVHSTLGHEDLEEDETSKQNKDDNVPDIIEVEEENKEEDEEEQPVDPLMFGGNRQNEDDGMGSEDDALETEHGDDRNTPIRHSPVDTPENEDESAPKEYDYIEEKKEDGSPGGSLALAPSSTEDNDDGEGSGNVPDGFEETPVDTHNKDDDWTEDEVAENDKENEAVPPLDKADSKEITDGAEETPVEKVAVDIPPNKVSVLDVLGGDDNTTEEETGSGAGLGAGVRVEDEETSHEADEGSGQPALFGPVPTIKEDTDLKEDEEEEDGSGKGLFIPVPSGHDTTSDWEEPVAENEGEENVDNTNAATTLAPVVAPEEEIIPRHHEIVFSPPEPPKTHEEPTSLDENEEKEKDRTDSGRGLNIPLEPEPEDHDEQTKDDKNEESGEVPFPSPTGEAGEADVVVDGDVGAGSKGNIEAGPGADGTEALNKADIWSLNSIGSYVVLGAIMLIVVVLLGYAVCRSRRQKSASSREKDVESAGKELQDVNKPLINNHHPSAPEKQPLDETRQPLMTKEQEASLTIDPEKKQLTEDNTDAANHKPKQNGTVPEVVVERQNGLKAATTPPAVNGKASSPASERAPSPAVPTPAPSPTPTPAPAASPAPSPTADAAHTNANGNAVPLANGGSVSPGATTPTNTQAPPAPVAAPVSPGAVRVVAKELPDSVAKRPVIIMNRGADQQQV